MSDDNPPVDHVMGEGEGEGEGSASDIEKNLKSRPTWFRLVFMVVFYALVSVAAMVATVVVVLGFLWVLFTGDVNPRLKSTGQSLATYLSQVMRYLTFNSNDRPFPFDLNWPSGDAD